MVPLDLDPCSVERVTLAQTLAQAFSAQLIGVTACEALPLRLYGKGAYINARIVQEELERAARDFARVEATFRNQTADLARIGWHAQRGDLMATLMRRATAADLVIVSRPQQDGDSWCDCLDPGELILRLGRPVLIVPNGISALSSRRIVIAWKDTREARRAVSDGLPFLAAAEDIWIVAVDPEASQEDTSTIAEFLAQHGISRISMLFPPVSGTVTRTIIDTARECCADLIIAGAYGHSRLHERVFGSVTRQLLTQAPICCLMSH
ncbi:hypothetical protein MPEAHAMD_7164 [Methylobacterium frigidaeris]|uniref:UspA domain-containing protein n=2 Tax=Methylobacterium frigidaeris TaxID=2038277 RepID=A0AA37HJ64_9HYPH|nr:hypothetical protein MPEAHAMD_7164 [Methylobacterium frigidaeris]